MAEASPQNESIDPLIDIKPGLDRLAGIGTRRTFQKNYVIASPGSVCDVCYLIVKGQVIAFDYTYNGTEHDFILHDPGSMFLESQTLLQMVIPVYFRATRETEVSVIERHTLIRAMREDYAIAALMINTLSNKFDYAMHRLRNASTFSSMWRLCDLLVVLSEKYGTPYDGKVMIGERISQQMMSQMLHVNRSTVIRNMNTLKKHDLIEQINGYYCLRDVKGIRLFQSSLQTQRRK